MWFLVTPFSRLHSIPFIVFILTSKISIKCEQQSSGNHFGIHRDCIGLQRLIDLLSSWNISEQLIIFQQDLHCASNLVSLEGIQFTFEECPSFRTAPMSHFCDGRTSETIVIYTCPAETAVHVKWGDCKPAFRRQRWIALSHTNPLLRNSMQKLSAWPSVSILFFHWTAANPKLKLYDSSATEMSSMKPIESLDTWGELSQSNLHGKTLRIAVVQSDQYEFDTKVGIGDDGLAVLEGSFVAELLLALQFAMNFTYVLKLTNSWGYFDKSNSTWNNGMVADLLHGEADLGLSSTADVPSRRIAVDFNIPTTSLKLSAFFVPPQPTAKTGALLHPFQTDVWVAILFWLVLLTSVLAIFNKITRVLSSRPMRPMVLRPNTQDTNLSISGSISPTMKSAKTEFIFDSYDEDGRSSNVAESWVLAVASVCSRGFYWYPKNDGHRAVVLSSYLAGFALMAAYGGTLISFLSVTQESIRNFEALLAARFKFVISTNEVLLKSILQESDTSVHRQAYARLDRKHRFSDLADAKQHIFQGSSAFLYTDVGAYHDKNNKFTPEESCSVKEINVPFIPVQNQGTMVPKNSPLKRVIDYNILHMIEVGLVVRWKKRYIPGKEMKCTGGVSFNGVQIISVTVAFGILCGGAVLSVLALLIEIRPMRKPW